MASFVFDFQQAFKSLTGNNPFPWQEALFEKMSGGLEEIPPQCNLPTGLGKTSIIAVWLIALAQGYKVPRRLVYVVNRRTVVDQTTEEVERYAQALVDNPELKALRKSLEKLCALPLPIDNDGRSVPPLAISTLRGQFADNREWSTDPTRPAVICGTVDMIGSRLLFSGYGVGWKSRPLHAGFLGQDTLLVHDEAHLEPAFQRLIEGIEQEQRRSNEFGSFRVLELTATAREAKQAFAITSADKKNRTVHKRFHATKNLRFHKNSDEKKLAEEITALALAHKNSGRPILIFVQTAKNVLRIRDLLAKEKQKDNVVVLTGTMRGEERDKLAKDLRFQRFLPKNDDTTKDPSEPYPGTVYLICTSAGEVGVNISADHLVCDLTTFESMAQRFGRVNRFGEWDDTRVDLIHPTKFDHDDPHDARREKTLELLKSLDEDASPAALDKLDPTERAAAFAP